MAMDAANRRSQALSQAGLNLGRQFTDVGVTLAAGMNPFFVLMQQGPQILDAFQVAAIQTGTTVRGAMVAMGAAIWTAMAPLLPAILAIGAAAATIGGAFALATRSISRDIGDVTESLNLTEAQMKRVEEAGISTTATAGDAFRGLGTTVKDMFRDVFGDELDQVGRAWSGFLDDATTFARREVQGIGAAFLGTFYLIRDTWRLLPAALGDAAISGANAAIAAIEGLANRSTQFINSMIVAARQLSRINPALSIANSIPLLEQTNFGRIANQFSGGMEAVAQAAGDSYRRAWTQVGAGLDGFLQRWADNTAASARNRILEAAGDPDAARAAGERSGNAMADGVERAMRRRREAAPELYMAGEQISGLPVLTGWRSSIQGPEIITDQLNDLINRLDEVDAAAKRMAGGFGSAFGQSGRAIGDLITVTTRFNREVADVLAAQQTGQISAAKAVERRRAIEIQSYGDMAGAAKELFDRNSAGYRALQAVESAYRAFQLASSVASIAQGWIETSQSVAQATAKTGADTAAGGAKMFSQLGVFAFPAVAAMVAVLAGLGARGGSASVPTLPTTNTGTGTVLGAPNDASASIANSLEMAERYYQSDLRFSSEMVDSLRAIETNIGAVTTAIARQVGVGGAFDTSGLNLGTTTGGGFLGIGQTTRTRDLVDQGLQLASGSLADLIAGGVQGLAYQVVQTTKTKSGFLGIGGGTSTFNTETSSAIDQALASQLGQLLGSLRDGVLSAATVLGVQGAGAVLDTFRVELGRISFEGMSNAEVSEALSAVFSKVGDQMAGAIIPGLEAFQRAGEGLMETLTRLAVEYQTVDDVLSSIGMTFRTVGLESIEARTRLVELSGGLDAFIESADLFASEFLTDAQRLAPVQAAVNAELTRLGIASDITREQFASLVLGLDVSTASGAAMYAALMNLAPAFDVVADAADQAAAAAAQLAGQRRSLEIQLMEATGNTAGALAARRALELEAMDASLRGLQESIWAAEDMAAASAAAAQAERERAAEVRRQYEQWVNIMEQAQADSARLVSDARNVLTQAYQSEAGALNDTINRFGALGDQLREFRETLGGNIIGDGIARTRAEFERIQQLARLGDADAMGRLSEASSAYLERAAETARSSLEYNRIVAEVMSAVDGAIGTADRTRTNAERQLDALNASVDGLMDVNASVLSVREAIERLESALRVEAGTQFQVSNPNRDWGANPDVNRGLARITGFMGDFGAGGFQNWIVSQSEEVRQSARDYLIQQGQAYRIGFATGGVFTNGIVSRPTTFDMGLMGEAGPEAIMPLTWGPEGLGVRATANDNSELVSEVRALRQEMAEMRAAAVSTAVHTARTAAYTKQTADDLEQVVQGGVPIRTEAA